MPAAICTNCSQVSHWRNQRGVRLADLKCYCGGELKTAAWKDGAYQIRESAKGKGNTGRKKALCTICGRNCVAAPGNAAVTVKLHGRWFAWEWTVVVEADDVVCNRHCVRLCGRSEERLYLHDFDVETQDWLSKQVDGIGISYSFLVD